MLIVAGAERTVSGVAGVSYRADPALRLTSPWNLRPRSPRELEAVRSVVVHLASPRGPVLARLGDGVTSVAEYRATDVVAAWRRCTRFVGAHVVVDADGTTVCCADLLGEATYHAPPINGRSVGVVLVQQRDGTLYRRQLDALPRVVDAISEALAIPRRVALPYRGHPRLDSVLEHGVWGARDVVKDVGADNPGDLPLRALLDAGWEPF